MRILSLFDGFSCAKQAIVESFPEVSHIEYLSSEIDSYAIAVSQYNQNWRFNSCVTHSHLGDVNHIDFSKIKDIDILIAGSPCQGLSIAGKRLGLQDARSVLFYKIPEAIQMIRPKHFIIENVNSMKQCDKDIITNYLGVEPCLIDSSLVSAQSRKRLYWCNFPVNQPADTGETLQDILENGIATRTKSYCLDACYYKGAGPANRLYLQSSRRMMVNGTDGKLRLLTPIECERLQTVNDGHTEYGSFSGRTKVISKTQRYKMLGNGFTISVISHILEQCKNNTMSI